MEKLAGQPQRSTQDQKPHKREQQRPLLNVISSTPLPQGPAVEPPAPREAERAGAVAEEAWGFRCRCRGLGKGCLFA